MRILLRIPVLLLIAGCTGSPAYDPLAEYEEVDATTILDAPSAKPGRFAPAMREQVERGEYLVELLGCGSCHTDGALGGAADLSKSLGGSRIGIAFSSPLGTRFPGVVYPANITPDVETGIGSWSDTQIANAIRAGIGRHGSRRISSMPWQGYAKISDEDVAAIVSYLRSIEAVRHEVPAEVVPGQRAREKFVYFGVYRSR